jgi:hypothetical protein
MHLSRCHIPTTGTVFAVYVRPFAVHKDSTCSRISCVFAFHMCACTSFVDFNPQYSHIYMNLCVQAWLRLCDTVMHVCPCIQFNYRNECGYICIYILQPSMGLHFSPTWTYVHSRICNPYRVMFLVLYNWSPPTSTCLCSAVVQWVQNAQKL